MKQMNHKGAKFFFKHDPDPNTFGVFQASNDSEVLTIQVKGEGISADILIEREVNFQIKSIMAGEGDLVLFRSQKINHNEDTPKKEKKKKKSETYDQKLVGKLNRLMNEKMIVNGKMEFKIEEAKYGPDLSVVLSNDGSEFTILRDGQIIVTFASTEGPVGKSGGIFRVMSGEKRHFIISVVSLIYIAQVSFPKKAAMFFYQDNGQRPVLRSDSLSNSAVDTRRYMNQPRKAKTERARKVNTHDEKTVGKDLSPRKIKNITVISVEKDRKNDNSNQNLSPRNNNNQQRRGPISDKPLTTLSFVQCWDQLEAIAEK
jgi:hypothetical protein